MRLAFVGAMRSGKDTAAEFLEKKYDGITLKFADPIYHIETMVYKYLEKPIPADKTKRRQFLQFIGTEFGRNTVGEDIWCEIMERQIKYFELCDDCFPNFFITDVRFPNEVALCKKLGFNLVYISRLNVDRKQAGATQTDHISENALSSDITDKMYQLSNYGTLDQFHQDVDHLYNWINSKQLESK